MVTRRSLALLAPLLGLLSGGGSLRAAQAVAPDAMSTVADTGLITLGPDQLLRLTVASRAGNVNLRFRSVAYSDPSCDGPVCIHPFATQATTGTIALSANAAASFEVAGVAGGARGFVLSDSPASSLRVIAELVDAGTGQAIGTIEELMEF
jgi:hypothetical protein